MDTLTTSTTTTVSPAIEMKNPYPNGFWDNLVHDGTLSDEDKLKKIEQKIKKDSDLFKLFVSQLDDFINKNVKNNSVDQPAAKALKLFFVNKLQQMEKAHLEFLTRIDAPKDFVDMSDPSTCFKTYNGKLHGKPKEQAEYALAKYLIYREAEHFIKLFPIDLPSLNSIIAKRILENVQLIIQERNEFYEGTSTVSGLYSFRHIHREAPKFVAISAETYLVDLNEQDTLKYFVETRHKKWLGRLNKEQKSKIFTQPSKNLVELLSSFGNQKQGDAQRSDLTRTVSS